MTPCSTSSNINTNVLTESKGELTQMNVMYLACRNLFVFESKKKKYISDLRTLGS